LLDGFIVHFVLTVRVLFEYRYSYSLGSLREAFLTNVHDAFGYVSLAELVVTEVFAHDQLVVVEFEFECILAELDSFI
jgi:hypothetical protein